MTATDKMLAEWFWTDRWQGSSAFLLPLEARGLYREMLTAAWRRGGELPNDHEAIRRAVGCTAAEWRRAWPKVEKYWAVEGALIFSPTQREIFAQCKAERERAREHARAGARAKHAPRNNGVTHARGLPEQVPGVCSPEPGLTPLPPLSGSPASGSAAGPDGPPSPARSRSRPNESRAGPATPDADTVIPKDDMPLEKRMALADETKRKIAKREPPPGKEAP